MMMREQQWDRSNCRHFRIDVCLHQRIYMRAFVNARNKSQIDGQKRTFLFNDSITILTCVFIVSLFFTLHDMKITLANISNHCQSARNRLSKKNTQKTFLKDTRGLLSKTLLA